MPPREASATSRVVVPDRTAVEFYGTPSGLSMDPSLVGGAVVEFPPGEPFDRLGLATPARIRWSGREHPARLVS